MVLAWSNVVKEQFIGRDEIKGNVAEQERRSEIIKKMLMDIQHHHGTRGWYMLLAGMILLSVGAWRSWINVAVVEVVPGHTEPYPGLGHNLRLFVQAIVDDDSAGARAVWRYEARLGRLIPFVSHMISLLGPNLVDGPDVRLPPLENHDAQ